MPIVASVNPNSVFAGSPGGTLVVTGTNFVSASAVQWNGSVRATTFVSGTTLQAAITAADVATAVTAVINVSTPAPGGGTSGGLIFTINYNGPIVSLLPSAAIVAAGAQQQFTAAVTNSFNTAVVWQVNHVTGGNSTVGTITSQGLYSGPAAAMTVTIDAVPQADATKSASANLTVLAPHRFGVRTTSALAEFYDRTTGNVFIPRGNNYIRLAPLTQPNGNPYNGHSTFIPGLYDPVRTETALANMQAGGYNLVTVILEGCCQGTLGDPAGGLSSAYIANVVDFLKRAKSHAISVVFGNQFLPAYGGFNEILGHCYPQFDDINLTILSSCGIHAAKMFFQDFVQGLVNADAPMDAVFAYEVWDEYYYYGIAAPLNATSGTVIAANGRTYDMSSMASKQQMMDEGLVYFADQIRAAILALDPTALVTISFFPPEGPNPSRLGDPRIISVYPAVASSTLDYVDLHPYPIVLNLTMDQAVQNFGFLGYQQQKPVLMGEFGAFKSAYPSVSSAASGLQSWQIQSCAYNFKGWALWTWDTDEQPELWNAQSQGGIIGQALSPVARLNPCAN